MLCLKNIELLYEINATFALMLFGIKINSTPVMPLFLEYFIYSFFIFLITS